MGMETSAPGHARGDTAAACDPLFEAFRTEARNVPSCFFDSSEQHYLNADVSTEKQLFREEFIWRSGTHSAEGRRKF